MTRALFAIPGDLASLTGGYGYDRKVLGLLPQFGVDVVHCRLPDGFPHPGEAALATALRQLREEGAGRVLLVDGLAFGVLPASVLAEFRNPLVALVHHPLALETGLSGRRKASLVASERQALHLASHVVVTSDTTRETLVADFGVEAARITIALPGTDPAPRSTGSNSSTPTILAVGSLVPRKGYDVLVRALAGLVQLPWRLRIIGSPDRAPETAVELRDLISSEGLSDRIALAGEMNLAALQREYARADLFVLPSHYEGYGMVLGEAMARGLPIVTTTGGAAARTVPDAAALKVPPGDCDALRAALGTALADEFCRTRLAAASWAAGQALPGWDQTAGIIASVLHEVGKDLT